jgi:glycosyltransferase involved in cell wall biosynthesis
MKVSVLMITYNHEKFIKEAALGVLMQKCTFEIELIIGDDSSTDNTRNNIMQIIESHPRGQIIKYTRHNKNLGVAKNFVWTLSQCKGKYVALCEGDDYWTDPYKLQKQVDFLEANPDYVITYHDAMLVDINSKLIAPSKLSDSSKRDFSSEQMRHARNLILTMTMCFQNLKNDFPQELNEAKKGDQFLISFLGNYGKGKYMEDILPSAYRIHSGGIWSLVTHRIRHKYSRDTYDALSRFYSRRNDKQMVKHFDKCKIHSNKTYLFQSVHEKRTSDVLRSFAFSFIDSRLYVKPSALYLMLKTVLKFLITQRS